MSTGMEIALPSVRQHEAILVPRQSELDKWSGGGEAGGEALIRYTMAELAANDALRSCTPTSIYLALLSCAVTGLVPGKLKGYSFLVPFGNMRKGPDGKETRVDEATFMVGWKGVKHMGYRVGIHMVSAVIHENDTFEFNLGTNRFVRYQPALKASGAEIGAAAWAELPRGGLEVEYLTMDTLNKIKAAATRIRKSPAWDGPFADQMRRKSALKRLGKQVEMGEDFFRAQAIEDAQDEDGHPGRALDELCDGAASKFTGKQSVESASFGHLPRPAQVQVPANVPTNPPVEAEGKLAAATDKARAKDKARPTQAAATASSSAATSTADRGSSPAPSSPAASPTSPTPATSTAGSASAPSAATPAASSAASSSTTPAASGASAQTSSQASGAEGADDQSHQSPFGDVASEPTDGDTSFDTSFFGDATEDPVDSDAPRTRAGWIAEFNAWAEAHGAKWTDEGKQGPGWIAGPNAKASAIKDWPEFEAIFRGWTAACSNKTEMEEDKPVFTGWSRALGFQFGRKPDPAKKIAAIPPDKEIVWMQDAFAKRHKELP